MLVYKYPVGQTQKLIQGLWQDSDLVMGVVGDVSRLRPILMKIYPTWNLVIVPYKQAISELPSLNVMG